MDREKDVTRTADALTVWVGTAMHTFTPGRDITIGRSTQADIHVEQDQALVSRVHLILRHRDGAWLAVDNNSRNGIYLAGQRVRETVLHGNVVLNLGAPQGPALTFRTTAHPVQPPIAVPPPPPPAPAPPPQPPVPPAPPTDQRVEAGGDDLADRVTVAVKRVLPQRPAAIPAAALTIGRSQANSVMVDDPLASRTHAYLLNFGSGVEIRDNRSSNGTFVNGRRTDAALLHPGDLVTIGNTDLVFNGTTLEPRRPETRTDGLIAQGISLTIGESQLLSNVSLTAGKGTLTAVIGPSGAGKSTFIKVLAGSTEPTGGCVIFDAHDVNAEYASMRSRIGMVPQDDVVHRQLTVEQALNYAAELRLPPDTGREDRQAVVERVLQELELTQHRAKRVEKLSGGQRKRASVAMELLTGPSLLILDEPTSGLDPALDRQVMLMLRRLADAGRTVVVVTHSLTYLDMCDQVLLLAPGGKTAFAGPPSRVRDAMGTTDWADIFAWVSGDPDGAHRAYLAANPSENRAPITPSAPDESGGQPRQTSAVRQVSTLARRQIRLILADTGYLIFLAILPFILGAVTLVVPGSNGLGVATAGGDSPSEPNQLLVLLNVAAVFMGTAISIRDLIGERSIFRREQSVGLSASAYLTAKILVFGAVAAVQTAILTAIVVYGKGAPTQGALLTGNASIDLYLTLAATAMASAMLGLALSSLAKTTEQILPMLVVVIMLSLVFAGGMIPVTGRAVLQQLSWLFPARWGFAASAATVDLLKIAPLVSVDDPLWHHTLKWWLVDMGVLALLAAALAGFVRWRLRLPVRDSASGDQQAGPRSAPRWVVVVLALLGVAVFMLVLSFVTRGGGPRDTTPPVPAGVPATPPSAPATAPSGTG